MKRAITQGPSHRWPCPHLPDEIGLAPSEDLSGGEERLILLEDQLAAEGGRELADERLKVEATLRLEERLAVVGDAAAEGLGQLSRADVPKRHVEADAKQLPP